jgi:hypothetical protein
MLSATWLILLSVTSAQPDSPPAARLAGTAETVAKPVPPPSDSGIISRGSAVQGGPAPDIVIFYAGDVMGWTEPCG